MSAIAQAFARCRAEKRAAFVPFLTAGDPSLEVTEDLLVALAGAGADVIELGVPFSDPLADGPVIQASSARALAGGVTLPLILELVARYRNRLRVPIVVFTYYNPLHAYGLARFAEQASASGVDGVLCVDLPPEEAAGEYLDALRREGLDAIFLLAPTSTKQRVARVAKAGSGFLYYVSRTGTTGERASLPSELPDEVAALRKKVKLPIVVGFGVSTPEQASAVARFADGVVVGSALVRLVGDLAEDPELPLRVSERARQLANAIARVGGKKHPARSDGALGAPR
jgi:tryptophan synthase alpha chain